MPTREPPYWAVLFTSARTGDDAAGYEAAARRRVDLAKSQPGFLGVTSARGEDGVGITVSYGERLEAIDGWRRHADHRQAKQDGRRLGYASFELRIAKVERACGWDRHE